MITYDASGVVPMPVRSAIGIAAQAQFNPLLFAKGLATRLAGANCHIHECTPATEVDADECIVRTPFGDVKAGFVILATHTPKGRLLIHSELSVNREYGIAARLPAGPIPPGIFWSADEPFRSVRRYAFEGNEYVIVVGEEHRTGHADDTNACYAALEKFAQAQFGVARTDYRWSAQNYRSVDGLPYIGRSAAGDRVLIATAFAADGLTYAGVAAKCLADLVAGRDTPEHRLFDPRRAPPARAAKEIVTEGAQVLAQYARDLPGLHRGVRTRYVPARRPSSINRAKSWPCTATTRARCTSCRRYARTCSASFAGTPPRRAGIACATAAASRSTVLSSKGPPTRICRHERSKPTDMLLAGLIALAVAALLGATLLSYVLRGKHTPKGLALLHGPLAAVGLVLLIIYWLQTGTGPRASILLFAIAAAGGVVLIVQDLRRGRVPKLLAVGHGLIALAGFALLVVFWRSVARWRSGA